MKLRIIKGKRRGKEFSIGESPVVVGRSRSCGIVLADDQLVSTEHAEVSRDNQGQLLVRDLESVNGIDVNGERTDTTTLQPGDQLTIGGTTFEVIEDVAPPPKRERKQAAPAKTPPLEMATGHKTVEIPATGGEAASELEFAGKDAKRSGETGESRARKMISLMLTAVITIVILGGGFYLWNEFKQSAPRSFIGGSNPINRTDLFYEKVQASKQNIFRYALRITGGMMTLNIDDLKQRRHLQKEKKLSDRVLTEMLVQLDRAGFEKLNEKYGGLPAEQQETASIEITRGTAIKHVEVENAIPPDAFATAQKTLEEFAQTELGLVTLSRSREELLRDADQAFQRGKRLYDAQDVDYPNLFNSLKEFQSVQLYLDSIDPKPEIYTQSVALEAEARRSLDEKINNLRFSADKSIKLSEWSKARAFLQEIIQRIPDRDDERYREAERRLIVVQAHLAR